MEICHTNEEEVIARKAKSAVRGIVTKEFYAMDEEALADILMTSLRNWQDSIRSVVYFFRAGDAVPVTKGGN